MNELLDDYYGLDWDENFLDMYIIEFAVEMRKKKERKWVWFKGTVIEFDSVSF